MMEEMLRGIERHDSVRGVGQVGPLKERELKLTLKKLSAARLVTTLFDYEEILFFFVEYGIMRM